MVNSEKVGTAGIVWYGPCLIRVVSNNPNMKTKLYALLLLTLIANGLTAAPRNLITAKTNNGNWSSPSTWNLGSVPTNNDSIVIPAGIQVILDNSYTFTNVYITIGGTLNFNQNNTMALDINSVVNILTGGTLTATHPTPNELLTINGVTKYDGKVDGTISGPAAATSMTGPDPAGFSQVVLPVTFVSFTANRSEGTVQLDWNTSNEMNNGHFEVERSTNGSDWETIGSIAAGTNSMADSYTFVDANAPAAQTQYRIRQVDLDGNYAYSKVAMVAGTNSANAQVNIFASNKTVSIVPEKVTSNRLIVRVISIGGQVLQQQSIESTTGRIDLAVNNAITGVYVVQVTDGNQLSIAKTVML